MGIDDPEEWEENYANLEPDILAYLKLRIIVQALNEGWKPKFTEGEVRYHPWFKLFTDQERTKMARYEIKLIGKNNTDNYVTDYAGLGAALKEIRI